MDTIVKLCYQTEREAHDHSLNPKKPQCSYRLETVPLQDYQLIRVTIRETAPGLAENLGPRHLIAAIPARLRNRRLGRRLQQCRVRLQPALRAELAPLLDDHGDNYIVYGDNLPGEWSSALLSLPEFDAYENPKWIRRLLSHAVHADFIVLGNVPCLHALLCELAPRMKTLFWVAPDLTAQEQIEDFVEDFYQEYGLAINLRFLPDGGTYAQVRIPDKQFRSPVNVLDFTGEKYLPSFCPPEGSVWLDFASLPEKERRVEARRLKATYISLRKQWRKSAPVLDTAAKNRYNT